MSFQSKAQRGYLYSQKPSIAKKFASETSAKDYLDMPMYKKKKRKKVKDMVSV